MTTQIANEDLVVEKSPNPEGESSDYLDICVVSFSLSRYF